MPVSPRPEIASLPSCVHGAISEAEATALGRPILDFSVNSNPLGPSPRVAQALPRADISHYPDPDALPLVAALSRRLRVPEESVVAGNGSLEIIWMLALAYLRPGDKVLILGPTFGEYQRACMLMGAEVVVQSALPGEAFRPRLEEAARFIRTYGPRLVFLCNPNNPTGHYTARIGVEMLLEAGDESLFVVDEAYLPFVTGGDFLLDLLASDSLLLVRSMTKDHALAGLRLGYGLAGRPVADALRRVKQPWSVSAAAMAAGIASLEDVDHQERSREAAREAIDYLFEAVTRLGMRPYPASANFLLVEVATAPNAQDGRWWRARLLERGCCVRDCTSFALPGFIRIGARPLEECRQLVGAMREVVALV